MKEQQDQFCELGEEIEDIIPIREISAFPTKGASEAERTPQLKMIEIQREKEFYLYRPFRIEKHSSEEQESQEMPSFKQQSPFTEFYAVEQCVYMRHNNSSFNRFKDKSYYAGQFVNRNIFSDVHCSQTHEIVDILKEYYEIDPENIIGPKEGELKFDSRFESGNLFAAFKVSEYQYDLVMQNDTNSTGSNQWFYFSVEGLRSNKEYTFAVVNFTKSDSLFNYGMKPVVYSLVQNRHMEQIEGGWKRMGNEVKYKKGKLPRQFSSKMYCRLSFNVSTPFDKDKLWIAHSFPYSFQKLGKFISEKSRNKEFVTQIEVGKTLSRRVIPALVIAYPFNKKRDNRKAVVIMARQHPGQTQGSFVCQGVVQKLLSRSKETEFLLKNFVFYVIPMINPDGVVFGHYRTNLTGKDLNRKWNSSEKDYDCPEVVAIKSFLSDIHKQRQIRFILDLHGHSKKLNSFFYGNPYPQCPEAVRIFPYICSKLHSGVQYFDCTFTTEEYKKKAARVYLSYLFKLVHVYTYQSSFYAYEKEGKKIEFTPKQYRDLGGSLIAALFMQLEHDVKYQEAVEFNQKKNSSKEYLASRFVKYLTELKNSKVLLEEGAEGESGSQSRPEDGEINNEQLAYEKPVKAQTPLQKSRQIKSKSYKLSRKTYLQSKQPSFIRPTRNVRYLQMSKINSFVPDKQQFCLQPIKKKEPESNRKPKTMMESAQSQTDEFQSPSLEKNFSEAEIEHANLSHSFVGEQQTERKSASVMRSIHNKNSVIFRLQFMTNTSDRELVPKKKIVNKHALSQTLLSFSKEYEIQKKNCIGGFSDKQEKEQNWLKAGHIRLQTPLTSWMIMKKEATSYFSGAIQKYSNKRDQSFSYDVPINRINLDKSFSIKRKNSIRK